MKNEYIPSKACSIHVLADNHLGYNRWYDTLGETKTELEAGRLANYRMKLSPAHKTEKGTRIWALFDLSNGHKGSVRYLWTFPTLSVPVPYQRTSLEILK